MYSESRETCSRKRRNWIWNEVGKTNKKEVQEGGDNRATRRVTIVQVDNARDILHESWRAILASERKRGCGAVKYTNGWTEARRWRGLTSQISWDLLEVCRCWATLFAPLIGWHPLGPPGSAPRLPKEKRARILFRVALPSPISWGCATGFQLALKTNMSDWPRIRDTQFSFLSFFLSSFLTKIYRRFSLFFRFVTI